MIDQDVIESMIKIVEATKRNDANINEIAGAIITLSTDILGPLVQKVAEQADKIEDLEFRLAQTEQRLDNVQGYSDY